MNKVEYIKEQRRINAEKQAMERDFAIDDAKLYVLKEERKALDSLMKKVVESFIAGAKRIRVSPTVTFNRFPLGKDYPEQIVERWRYDDGRAFKLSMGVLLGVDKEINDQYADLFFSLFVINGSFPKTLEEEGFHVEWNNKSCLITMPE